MGSLLDHLGRACRCARENARVDQYAIAASAGTSRSTITRFESRGVVAPRRLEAIVDAYGAECDVDPVDLWRMALDAWEHDPDR